MRNPLLDEDFLHELDLYHHHHTWAKIVSLDFNEYPLEEISGKVSAGSINIDGNSAVRRTCSLTLLSDEVNINDFYWGLKTKFRLYVGLENQINDQYIIKKKVELQNSIDAAMAKGESTVDLRYRLEHIEELYRYPDIIWFNQGIFLISSFNCAAGVNKYTVSIQGKDKMSLLNGDMGGVIPASWDFGTMDENVLDEEGKTAYDASGYAIIKNTQIPIKDIVLQAVHEFAQEKWQNIIVNDLDDYGIELLEYEGTTPLYYIIKVTNSGTDSREVSNMTLDENMECMVKIVDWIDDKPVSLGWASTRTKVETDENNNSVSKQVAIKISELDSDWITETATAEGAIAEHPPKYSYERLIEELDPSGAVTESVNYYRTRIAFPDDFYYETAYDDEGNEVQVKVYNEYTVAKITRDNGLNVCGYRICDIVYPYDLIASPGDTVTSVLDKLVKMLGNFEYFFDEDGRFIFQKKRTFLDVSYNNIINEHSISPEVWADSSMFNTKYSYTFDSNTLVSSIQNNPNLPQLKNDYSIWGARQNGNVTIPIHMRYAIDKKPYGYRTFDTVDENGVITKPGAWYWTEEGLGYRQRRMEILAQEFKGEEGGSVESYEKYSYTKTPNENGLPETWWDVQDWAKYYGLIAALQDGKNPDRMTQEELEEYYPKNYLMFYKSDETKYPLPTYKEVASYLGVEPDYGWNGTLQMVIQQEDGSWDSHGSNCSHSYFQFIPNYEVLDENGKTKYYIDKEHGISVPMRTTSGIYENTKVYIYRPTFPGELDYSYEDGGVTTIDVSDYAKDQTYIVDWREVIYQMANDYRRHYREDDFLIKLRDNNKILYYNNIPIESLYPTGYTGYEKYYIDFEMNLSQGVVAYWRELYNPETINDKKENHTGYYNSDGTFELDTDVALWSAGTTYQKGDRAAVEEDGERVIYKSLKNNNVDTVPSSTSPSWLETPGQFTYNSDGWNIEILDNPEMLNFWFDFLDSKGEMNKYTVHNIGMRSKATNDDKIKAIYFRETPNVIFDVEGETVQKDNWTKPGYCYISIPAALNDLFHISSRGKNCMDVVEEYLYNYAYPISSITLSTIPIYYLTPNTLIYVNDPDTGVVGEYIMTKYSIQLGLNSSMSITGNETAKRLY